MREKKMMKRMNHQ